VVNALDFFPFDFRRNVGTFTAGIEGQLSGPVRLRKPLGAEPTEYLSQEPDWILANRLPLLQAPDGNASCSRDQVFNVGPAKRTLNEAWNVLAKSFAGAEKSIIVLRRDRNLQFTFTQSNVARSLVGWRPQFGDFAGNVHEILLPARLAFKALDAEKDTNSGLRKAGLAGK
jgi:hypothetical protein